METFHLQIYIQNLLKNIFFIHFSYKYNVNSQNFISINM